MGQYKPAHDFRTPKRVMEPREDAGGAVMTGRQYRVWRAAADMAALGRPLETKRVAARAKVSVNAVEAARQTLRARRLWPWPNAPARNGPDGLSAKARAFLSALEAEYPPGTRLSNRRAAATAGVTLNAARHMHDMLNRAGLWRWERPLPENQFGGPDDPRSERTAAPRESDPTPDQIRERAAEIRKEWGNQPNRGYLRSFKFHGR